MNVRQHYEVGAGQLYRAAVPAGMDVLSGPGVNYSGTNLSAVAGGALAVNTYYVAVVLVNKYGRASCDLIAGSPPSITTVAINKAIRINCTPFAGSVDTGDGINYDIYLSVAAIPKFVARVTLEQIIAGCLVTAQNTVTAGGVAGSVDVRLEGTGVALGTFENTAYALPLTGTVLLVDPASPAAIICRGYWGIEFNVRLAAIGDAGAGEEGLKVVLVPFFRVTTRTSGGVLDHEQWYMESPIILRFVGGVDVFDSFNQKVRIQTRGEETMHLLVAQVTGGATVDLRYAQIIG